MKRIFCILFLVCTFFSVICFGEIGVRKPIYSQSIYTLLKTNDFPNIFSPFGDLFGKVFGKKRKYTCDLPASVTSLDLDKTEIISSCSINKSSCLNNSQRIEVLTVAIEIEKYPLTYSYTVSGGKIIGEGRKVIWDLSNVKAGTYMITAAVSDGRCNFCGTPKTQSVTVKKCPDCKDE